MYTLCLKKGIPTLSIVTLKRINRFWRFLAQTFLTQLAIKWLFKFPPHPTYVSTLPGKTEQTKYALKWTANVNKLKIRSHKNLITVVWANEVHRLLTYSSTSCYQTCRWWHFRVSAVERTSASAREAIELLECETSDFISPDLWPPTAMTSIWSITSSGGHATAGLSDDVQECGWTQEATGQNLDWSGAEHYWHCYQCIEKTSACLCSGKGPTYRTLTVAVEQLYGTFG